MSANVLRMAPTSVSPSADVPKNADDYYRVLTGRNGHFVDERTQANIKNLKVVVAGCGAGGGACIEPLARLGVTHFRIADNGDYELANLNRQHTFVDQVGVNKAVFHRNELLRINPFIDVKAFAEGITAENLPEMVQWADLIIDTVDVTTLPAIMLKFRLHELAHQHEKAVVMPLDPGFCSMGETFDYRNPKVVPLDGRLAACKRVKNPIHGLMELFPVGTWPLHSLQLVDDLLQNAKRPASQLGCAADMLGGVIAALVMRFADSGELLTEWSYDLGTLALPRAKRWNTWVASFGLKRKIRAKVREMRAELSK